MENLDFESFQSGAINPALLMRPHQNQSQEYLCASPHSLTTTPMLTPLSDPCPTPYTPLSVSMEDFSRALLKQEGLTSMVDAEQDMTVVPYLCSSVEQSQKRLHNHQNGTLFPALTSQPWEPRRHTCPICVRTFTRKYNLRTHIRTHDKYREKFYSCPKCSRRFDRKHDCNRHHRTVHEGLKTHPCNICTRAFSRKDALARHMGQNHSTTAI